MRVSVIGTGYVGLVTGACLADIGHQVVCMDDDASKIEVLRKGSLPIYEPHLEELVGHCRSAGRLRFTADVAEAVREAAVIFICVNTPPLPNGEADLSYVELATRRIAEHATQSTLITEKSTVPVQTSVWIEKTLAIYSKRPGIEFDVSSNPEFTREGMAVEDFLHPDRIVIGVSNPRAEQVLRELYAPIVEGRFRCPIHADCRQDRDAAPTIFELLGVDRWSLAIECWRALASAAARFRDRAQSFRCCQPNRVRRGQAKLTHRRCVR